MGLKQEKRELITLNGVLREILLEKVRFEKEKQRTTQASHVDV